MAGRVGLISLVLANNPMMVCQGEEREGAKEKKKRSFSFLFFFVPNDVPFRFLLYFPRVMRRSLTR